jgi:signal transduction histidine kinase
MSTRSPILGEERRSSRRTDAPPPEGIERLRGQFRVLQDISRAYGATRDRDEAEIATVRWVRQALDDEKAGVRLILPDGRGRLVVRFSDGEGRGAARDPAALWKRAYELRRVVREEVPSAAGYEVAALPLVTHGEAIGVLEVVSTRDEIAAGEPVLAAVAGQAAILFRNLDRRAELHREIAVANGVAELARELLTIDSSAAAIEVVTRFCADHLSLPVAVWTVEEGRSTMSLTDVRAASPGARAAINDELGSIGLWGELSEADRARVLRGFARAVGSPSASPLVAGNGVVVLTGADESATLKTLRELLSETLGSIGYIDRARRRDEEFELALAWTAHEFRQPLVGVRAHVENLLYEEGPVDRTLLARLLAEVDELSSMVEPMLESSAGGRSLDLKPTDLPGLIQGVLESLPSELAGGRVRMTGEPRLIASVDEGQLRMALSNVIGNALMYSPPDSVVEVAVGESEQDATVRIVDRGPGVTSAEADRIFDPFVRGRAGAANSSGKGLGLFITRRVVEAHAGRVWIEPVQKGAVFAIRIPTRRSPGSGRVRSEPLAEAEPAGPSA